jgi:hypothetical protein
MRQRHAPTRDLAAAQRAYREDDIKASRLVHSSTGQLVVDEPGHVSGASMWSNQCLAHALESGFEALLLLSVFCFPADSALSPLSMFLVFSPKAIFSGMQTTFQLKQERCHYDREKARESWELKNFRQGEIQEMVELFTARGMSLENAATAVDAMAQHEDFFINIMMLEELGCLPPDTRHPPSTHGLFHAIVRLAVFGIMCGEMTLLTTLAPRTHDVLALWIAFNALLATSARWMLVRLFPPSPW